jgi:hypothetical protein
VWSRTLDVYGNGQIGSWESEVAGNSPVDAFAMQETSRFCGSEPPMMTKSVANPKVGRSIRQPIVSVRV